MNRIRRIETALTHSAKRDAEIKKITGGTGKLSVKRFGKGGNSNDTGEVGTESVNLDAFTRNLARLMASSSNLALGIPSNIIDLDQ